MPIRPASEADFSQIRELMRRSRHLFMGLGNEDMIGLLRNGLTALGESNGIPWGFLGIRREERPATLPRAAASRAYLHCIALAAGKSPSRDIAAMLNVALGQETGASRLQIIYFDRETWPVKPLQESGFAIIERVEYFQLNGLPRRTLGRRCDQDQSFRHETSRKANAGLYAGQRTKRADAKYSSSFRIRPVDTADVAALAHLDAETFAPIWHMGHNSLMELLFSCRVRVAEHGDRMVGYAALSTPVHNEAYLARLAVHPAHQGCGIGRALLLDSMTYAQTEGIISITLNTQTTNQPSQQLYRSVGFRPTGTIIPVLVKQTNQAVS